MRPALRLLPTGATPQPGRRSGLRPRASRSRAPRLASRAPGRPQPAASPAASGRWRAGRTSRGDRLLDRGPPVMVQRLPVEALALRRWPEQLGLLRRVGVPGADLELVAVGVLEVDRHGFDVQVGARSREWHAQTAQLLRDTVEHLGARAEGDVGPVAPAVAVGERLAV